jgi:hypothetical protein
MAEAVVARQQGDNFQARLFWLNAAQLLDPASAVRRVAYETPSWSAIAVNKEEVGKGRRPTPFTETPMLLHGGIERVGIDALAEKSSPVKQLPYSYVEIPERLDPITNLRGRYIVLSQGGKNTVVTNGEYKNFRVMLYVGGYLDQGQTINTTNSKHQQRLSGDRCHVVTASTLNHNHRVGFSHLL